MHGAVRVMAQVVFSDFIFSRWLTFGIHISMADVMIRVGFRCMDDTGRSSLTGADQRDKDNTEPSVDCHVVCNHSQITRSGTVSMPNESNFWTSHNGHMTGQFKRLLKTYLFGGWDRGAL